jgi:YVTN family beta-propeller protein
LWVANHDERTVARIDLASGTVVADIPVPSEPHRVAYGAGAVWVGNWHDDSVSRIDPATNRVVGSPIPIGAHHAGNLVVGAGDLWVTSDYRLDGAAEDVVVVRIDPADQPGGGDDPGRRPSDRCRGRRGCGLGIGGQSRPAAADRRALG